MDKLPSDIFSQVQSYLDWKEPWKCRGVSSVWKALFEATPYPNCTSTWELTDLPNNVSSNIGLLQKICRTIHAFETDEEDVTFLHGQFNRDNMVCKDDETRLRHLEKLIREEKVDFDQEWILPMISNLTYLRVSESISSHHPFFIRLKAGPLKKMIAASSQTLEHAIFEVKSIYITKSC